MEVVREQQMMSRGFSVREVAERLAVSEKTIRRMIDDGRLRAVNVTQRRKVIPATEISRILAPA